MVHNEIPIEMSNSMRRDRTIRITKIVTLKNAYHETRGILGAY